MGFDTHERATAVSAGQIGVERDIQTEIEANRFSSVTADEYDLSTDMRAAWDELREAWNNLEFDKYYGGTGGSFRQRRYTDFTIDPASGAVELLESKAYYQSKRQNSYVGGISRDFGAVLPETFENPLFKELVRFSFAQFPIPAEYASRVWACQVHQIRITVGPGETTDITPEGIHTDGYPFASVHLVDREGVDGAESSVYEWDETKLASLTFSRPLDSLYLEDRSMKHYVSPMSAVGSVPGYRSILAISFSLPESPFMTDE